MLSKTRQYIEEIMSINYNRNDEIVKEIFKTLVLKPSFLDVTPVFDLCKKLGIRVVTTDYKKDVAQFIERAAERTSFICVSSSSNCRRIRFNVATMIYCAMHSKQTGKFIVTKTENSDNLRMAKRFAANLLMPINQLRNAVYEKNEKGEYKYLVVNNGKLVMPFKNIHYIAERFGVEFSACAKRIFHSNVVEIRRILNYSELKHRLKSPDASEAMRRRMIGESCSKHDYFLKCSLMNNLYFPKITRIDEEICEKLRKETVKNDTIIEGVISSAADIERFLNKYKSGKITEMYKLPISQRIVIGHYETIKNLEDIPFNKYFFNELHARLYKYAVVDEQEKEWLLDPVHCNRGENDNFIDFIPGQYRKMQNAIMSARFATDEVADIYNTMSNIYFDTEYLLQNKDEMSNVEYINNVNHLVHRFCVCHPFEDGNGRVSRMFMNYLFIQKGLPPVYINASTRRDKWINALRDLSDDCRRVLYENIDYSQLNDVMMDGMLETESMFFPAKLMIDQPQQYIDNHLKTKKTEIKGNVVSSEKERRNEK